MEPTRRVVTDQKPRVRLLILAVLMRVESKTLLIEGENQKHQVMLLIGQQQVTDQRRKVAAMDELLRHRSGPSGP